VDMVEGALEQLEQAGKVEFVRGEYYYVRE
jgi:hypothetical protein